MSDRIDRAKVRRVIENPASQADGKTAVDLARTLDEAMVALRDLLVLSRERYGHTRTVEEITKQVEQYFKGGK